MRVPLMMILPEAVWSIVEKIAGIGASECSAGSIAIG